MQTDPSSPILVNLNGQILTPKDAKISIFDRGFLFGDSIYEVIRTYQGIPFLLQEHLDRLWYSAARLGMKISFGQERIIQEVSTLLGELGKENCYVRIIVTRGEGPLQMDPSNSGPNNLVIVAKELIPLDKKHYEKGVSILITDVERTSIKSVDPNIKSGNYLNNVLAAMHAKRENAFDAIMLNARGHVTEGTACNVWTIKNGQVFTPPLQAGILEGITRKTLLVLGRKNNILIEQKNILPIELINADECFLTSTTKEIVPVTYVNNAPIGMGEPGPITKSLQELYQNFIKKQIDLS